MVVQEDAFHFESQVGTNKDGDHLFKILLIDDNATEKGKKRSLIPQPPKPPLPPVPPRGVPPPSLGVPPIPPYHWMHPSKSSFVSKPYNIPGIRRL